MPLCFLAHADEVTDGREGPAIVPEVTVTAAEPKLCLGALAARLVPLSDSHDQPEVVVPVTFPYLNGQEGGGRTHIADRSRRRGVGGS